MMLSLIVVSAITAAAQNSNSSTTTGTATTKSAKKRGSILFGLALSGDGQHAAGDRHVHVLLAYTGKLDPDNEPA